MPSRTSDLMQCTWFADDYSTESGPSDFQSFGSFDAALASTDNFAIPNLVWGSLDAYFAADGSAPFARIVFNPGNQTWTWIVGANGPFPAVDSQGGGFATAQLALAAMRASGNQPVGFCTVSMNCDPASLAAAARCFCLPDDRQRGAMIYLLCQWSNKVGCTLPTAPIDLGVVTGDGQVTLIWPAGVGATIYNIKRALVPGGPYVVIGTSAASPYVDHAVVNYTEYYYVVSSTNACGESAGNSIESHATPFNIVVSGWSNRVQVNGGAAPSMPTTTSLDVFVNSLKACAIDSLMISVNCFVPDSLIAALTPLYVFGNDPWTNHNFVAGDLTLNGLIGDGATKYLDTGMVPANFNNSFAGAGGWFKYGITTYNVTTNNLGEYACGATDGVLDNLIVHSISGTGFSQFYCPAGPGANAAIQVANALWVGYLSGNCTAYGTTEGSHDAKIYEASSTVPHVQIGSNVVNSLAVTNQTFSLFCFGENSIGLPVNLSSKRLSFLAIHQGLTAAQSLCFYNAVQALRVAFGGGFV